MIETDSVVCQTNKLRLKKICCIAALVLLSRCSWLACGMRWHQLPETVEIVAIWFMAETAVCNVYNIRWMSGVCPWQPTSCEKPSWEVDEVAYSLPKLSWSHDDRKRVERNHKLNCCKHFTTQHIHKKNIIRNCQLPVLYKHVFKSIEYWDIA